MEKCGRSKPDQIDNSKAMVQLDEMNRNHPANKKDESKILIKIDFILLFKLSKYMCKEKICNGNYK